MCGYRSLLEETRKHRSLLEETRWLGVTLYVLLKTRWLGQKSWFPEYHCRMANKTKCAGLGVLGFYDVKSRGLHESSVLSFQKGKNKGAEKGKDSATDPNSYK